MRRILIAVLLLMGYAACNNKPTSEKSSTISEMSRDTSDQQGEIKRQNDIRRYELTIDSLGLRNLYDKTKWIMYCIHCDDTLQFWPETKIMEKVTFAQLPLQFDYLEMRGDTIEFNFFFRYKNDLLSSNRLIRNSIICGAVYKKGSDRILMYSKASTARYVRHTCPDGVDCHDRYIDPLQPEVIRYIKAHKEQLDPWFYTQSEKRGILQ